MTMADSFNPRPYVRGDVRASLSGGELVLFQSTPLREGRRTDMARMTNGSQFQSTPLREGRRGTRTRRYRYCTFQSTPLREGRRDMYITHAKKVNMFQSTPLREGRRWQRKR